MLRRKVYLCLIVLGVSMFLMLPASADVGYLGGVNSYTHEVTEKYTESKEALIPQKDLEAGIRALKQNKIKGLVVPIEGYLLGHFDKFVFDIANDLEIEIVKEINLQHRQFFVAKKGVELKDIKFIFATPKAYKESGMWLNKNFINGQVKLFATPEEAVTEMLATENKDTAAIAPPKTASLDDVKVLAEDIQYGKKDVNRYWVIAFKQEVKKKSAEPIMNQKYTVWLEAMPYDIGYIVNDLATEGYITVKIHDLPAKTGLGNYNFLLEFVATDKAKTPFDKVFNRKLPNTVHARILGDYSMTDY